jgi:hypothetical protein
MIPNMEVVLLWGTNLVSTGVHAMPFINQARENGATVVAIDPRVTRTTAFADWHLQPRPGTDAALALGMMKVIVDRGLHDEAFLRAHTVGWDQFIAEKLPQYPLERVEQITGIAAADIEKLALLYGRTRKSFIRLNWGIQRHSNGGKRIEISPCRRSSGATARRRLRQHWCRNPRCQPRQAAAHGSAGWQNAAPSTYPARLALNDRNLICPSRRCSAGTAIRRIAC